jgi:hypothetical protein
MADSEVRRMFIFSEYASIWKSAAYLMVLPPFLS